MKTEQEDDGELLGGAIKDFIPVSMDTEPVPAAGGIQQFIGDLPNRKFQTSPYKFLQDYQSLDMGFGSNVPGFLMDYRFVARGETDVRDAITRRSSGLGADHDHPHVRHATVHSLQKHPELLRTYLNGAVRA